MPPGLRLSCRNYRVTIPQVSGHHLTGPPPEPSQAFSGRGLRRLARALLEIRPTPDGIRYRYRFIARGAALLVFPFNNVHSSDCTLAWVAGEEIPSG